MSQSVLVDATVRLDCVTGYSAPPADIHWLHNGTETTTGRHDVALFGSLRDGGAASQRTASLTLRNVSVEDGGFYQCEAVNPVSRQKVRSDKAFVNVTGITHVSLVENMKLKTSSNMHRQARPALSCWAYHLAITETLAACSFARWQHPAVGRGARSAVLVYYPPYVSMEEYIGCCLFLCSVTDISAMVAPIGMKFCMMVHIGSGQIFCFGGGTPWAPKSEILGLNFGHLTTISKTVSRSVTCQLELNISSTRAF